MNIFSFQDRWKTKNSTNKFWSRIYAVETLLICVSIRSGRRNWVMHKIRTWKVQILIKQEVKFLQTTASIRHRKSKCTFWCWKIIAQNEKYWTFELVNIYRTRILIDLTMLSFMYSWHWFHSLQLLLNWKWQCMFVWLRYNFYTILWKKCIAEKFRSEKNAE